MAGRDGTDGKWRMVVSLRLNFPSVMGIVLSKMSLGVSLCGMVWVEVIDEYVREDERRLALLQAEPGYRCLIVLCSLSRSPVKSILKSSFFALCYNGATS